MTFIARTSPVHQDPLESWRDGLPLPLGHVPRVSRTPSTGGGECARCVPFSQSGFTAGFNQIHRFSALEPTLESREDLIESPQSLNLIDKSKIKIAHLCYISSQFPCGIRGLATCAQKKPRRTQTRGHPRAKSQLLQNCLPAMKKLLKKREKVSMQAPTKGTLKPVQLPNSASLVLYHHGLTCAR